MFMSVITWRGLAENVAKSFSKGDPIIVSGKLKVRRWDSGERQGTSVEIEAVSLGHDLSRGTSSFTRVKRSISAEELHVDEQSDSVVDSWLAEGSSSNAA
jgi:single-strand DNA-binding protein